MYGDDAWKAASVALAVAAILAVVGIGAIVKWALF